MYNLLYIIPILGIIFAAVFAFFIVKQKINEYDYKITSIFSLLSAITDEITKLKNPNNHNKPVFISDDLDSTTNYHIHKEDDDENESDEVESDEIESDDDENDEHDEDDFDDEDDEEIKDDSSQISQIQEISNNVEEEILKNLEEKKDTDKEINIDLEPVDYQNMTVKQLRDLAKQRGFKGDLTKLKRTDLIDSLENKDIKI